MCKLDQMTPDQLNAMTKADLIAGILQDVRKSSSSLTHDAKGNVILQQETITDAYDTLLGTVTMEPTYYEGGEVDLITITQKDAEGKVTGGHRIKHYVDGREPELLPLDGK